MTPYADESPSEHEQYTTFLDIPQLIKNRNYVKFRGASGDFTRF